MSRPRPVVDEVIKKGGEEVKGLGTPNLPMKCRRCGQETVAVHHNEHLNNGWLYMHWLTEAKRWQAAFLCADCASQFEVWLEET